MPFEAWSIYGARLPSCELRMAVKDTIHEHFTSWDGPDLLEGAQLNISCSASGMHRVKVDQLVVSHETAKSSTIQQSLGKAAVQVESAHQTVLEAVLSDDFVRQHGFYGNSSAWKEKWLL